MKHKPEKEARAKLIRASITGVYEPGATELKSTDGEIFKICISEVLRSYQHGDMKYVKEDYYSTLSDPENAKSPEGKAYAKIIKGWGDLSFKKKKRVAFNDYWDYINQIELEYDAEIKKAETIEIAMRDASCEDDEDENVVALE